MPAGDRRFRSGRGGVLGLLILWAFWDTVASAETPEAGKPQGVLERAVRSAEPGAVIRLDPGVYEVDNPLVLDTPGLTLTGAGRERTTIRPRNPWREVIRISASDVTLQAVEIDGRLRDGESRAAFAILIEDGLKDFTLRDSRLAHAGASLLLGNSISGCIVADNVLHDSGDDAIRLRGDHLEISGNIIRDYFDEAIDLGNTKLARIARNHVSWGRIGITLFNGSGITLTGNVVEDQFLGGIDLPNCNGNCVVSENVVRGRQKIRSAFRMTGPAVITGNIFDVPSDFGVRLEAFYDGEFSRNAISGAEIGLLIGASPGTSFSDNQVCATSGPAMVNEDGSALELNGDAAACEGPDIAGRARERSSALLAQLRPEAFREDVAPAAARHVTEVEVIGEGDLRGVAAKVAEQFAWKNPGVLSLRFDGESLLSEVSEGFYRLLEYQPELAIGLVRAPFLAFHANQTKPFSVWRLTRDKNEVAVVTWHRTGANVRVYILADGRLGLAAQFQMLLDWVPERLRYTRFGAYVTGGEGVAAVALIGALLVACLLAILVLRLRRATSRR